MSRRRKARRTSLLNGIGEAPVQPRVLRSTRVLDSSPLDGKPLSAEEASRLIEARMKEQDLRYLQRAKEGRVTPEWRNYALRRKL